MIEEGRAEEVRSARTGRDGVFRGRKDSKVWVVPGRGMPPKFSAAETRSEARDSFKRQTAIWSVCEICVQAGAYAGQGDTSAPMWKALEEPSF